MGGGCDHNCCDAGEVFRFLQTDPAFRDNPAAPDTTVRARQRCKATPAARTPSLASGADGILLISRTAAPPTARTYRSSPPGSDIIPADGLPGTTALCPGRERLR